MKQTSTQWLQEALELHLTEEQKSQFLGLFLQAHEMNREEIISAYNKSIPFKFGKEYYNETYNNPE